MPKIIKIPGRSGFYLRVAVPRGKLRDALGTCDVVKKIGNTKEEAEKNISSAEKAIQQKFDEKLREDGIHAAAVVISPDTITNYLPVQQKGKDAELVTQSAIASC